MSSFIVVQDARVVFLQALKLVQVVKMGTRYQEQHVANVDLDVWNAALHIQIIAANAKLVFIYQTNNALSVPKTV